MGNKKKFIDKKSAVKFKVVHRSQYDPLIADQDAPKYVLVPVAGDVGRADEFVNYGPGGGEDHDGDEHDGEGNRYSRLEKQAQYGIYYDDDYDYMQHLKEAGAPDAVVIEAVPEKKNRSVRFNLPSDVLPSVAENDYAPLELQAQQGSGLTVDMLAADFDVMAQLDDDAEHCEEWAIDDDFITMAQEEGEYYDTDEEADFSDDRGEISDGDADFAIEETRSRFTEYSMTSSVMHRNDKLQLLDERFERMYAEYDEENIGELSEEDVAEGRDIAEFEDILDEYILSRENIDYNPENKPAAGLKDCAAVRHIIEGAVEEDMTEEERTAWRERMERKDEWLAEIYESRMKAEDDEPKWDCETILTTYSNIYNHPRLISERKPRQPAPVEERVSEAEELEESGSGSGEEGEDAARANIGAKRDKGETQEEKKARKQAVKAARKERREEKKSTKLAFKAEKLRQEKISTAKGIRL